MYAFGTPCKDPCYGNVRPLPLSLCNVEPLDTHPYPSGCAVSMYEWESSDGWLAACIFVSVYCFVLRCGFTLSYSHACALFGNPGGPLRSFGHVYTRFVLFVREHAC